MKILSAICFICALFAALLGLTVISGWYLHKPSIIQILPHFVPMQFNTALGFLIGGVAAMLITKHPKPALFLATILLLLSSLSLVQYIAHINLGIDELFMKSYIKTASTFPGRMAPNTAFCFMLVALSIFSAFYQNKLLKLHALTAVFISIVFLLGALSLLGYLLDIKITYSWGNITGMAVHTAVGFLLLSLALSKYIVDNEKYSFKESFTLCGLIGAISFSIFLLSWQSLIAYQDNKIKAILHRESQFISSDISKQLQNEFFAIIRFFERRKQIKTPELFQNDMKNYFVAYKDIIAFNVYGSHKQQLYVSPSVDLTYAKKAKARCQDLLFSGKYYQQNNLKYITTSELFCITDKSQSIMAVIDLHKLASDLFSNTLLKKHGIQLSVNNMNIYTKGNLQKTFFIQQWGVSNTFKLFALQWSLTMWLDQKGINKQRDNLPAAYMFLGVLLTILLMYMVRLWQRTSIKNRELLIAQQHIKTSEKEIKRQAKHIQLIYDASNLASTDNDSMQILQQCLNLICEIENWPVGHIYLPTKGNDSIFESSKIWYEKEPNKNKEFREVTEKTTFTKDIGLPGRILSTKKASWITNVHTDDNFPRAKVNQGLPVHAAAGFPILIKNKVVAIFEFFSLESKSPDQAMLTTFSIMGEQLGRIFEKNIAKKALERSNQELDSFAYIASHDLKEPLRGISNFADFLLEDYSKKLDEEGVSQLKTLKNLSVRMQSLISALLEYSRIGRVEYALIQCDLNEIMKEKSVLLSSFLKENNAQLIIKKSLPSLVCDHVKIGEVFYNLITNAIKYNDSTVKTVEIDYSEKNNDYIFSVTDNGIGIATEHQEQVFTIFKRLHGRNEYGGGTGAGMTIVKKIIERHHGTIWCESKLGEGTTFYFSIPKNLLQAGDNNALL